MQEHLYRVGDIVEFVPGPFHRAPPGDYRVVQRLPPDNVENQYRIQNARDGHERVVRESQLKAS
jgi:hypothetical protein